MDGGPIHKNLGKMAGIDSEEKVLSLEYYLPVYFGENIEGTLKII